MKRRKRSTDREILEATQDVPQRDVIYEQLAHHAAYGRIDEASLARWGYELSETIADPETGIQIVVLRPAAGLDPDDPQLRAMHDGQRLRPVIAFRGTTDVTAALDDLNAAGIGAHQFGAMEGRLMDLMAELAAGDKVDVVGHSLGGALAQTAAAHAPGLVGHVATFSSPGISKKDADRVKRWNEAHPDQAITSGHYRVKGDVVPEAGEAWTEGSVITFDTGKKGVDAHIDFPLAQLNDLRGGPVEGTVGNEAWNLQSRGLKSMLFKGGDRGTLKADATSAESRIRGVETGTTDDLGRGRLEGLRAKVGSKVAKLRRQGRTQQRYAAAWEEAKRLYWSGVPPERIDAYIDATKLDAESKERMKQELEVLYGPSHRG